MQASYPSGLVQARFGAPVPAECASSGGQVQKLRKARSAQHTPGAGVPENPTAVHEESLQVRRRPRGFGGPGPAA